MITAEKLINQTVIHKTFGKGIISGIDDKHLMAEFKEKDKIGKFSYPACFNGFLTLEDKELQKEMDETLGIWKQITGEARKEELREQYEKTVQGIKERHQAAEERKIKAAQRVMEHRFNYNVKKEKEK